MKVDRRRALRHLAQLFVASPLLQRQLLQSQGPPAIDPVLEPANVFDFAKLAKEKLDPVAWDYMAEGASDEAALRDARKAFSRIIIRPRFLTDVTRSASKPSCSEKRCGIRFSSTQPVEKTVSTRTARTRSPKPPAIPTR